MNQAPPFVVSQTCTALTAPYLGFFNTCDPNSPMGGSLSNSVWDNSSAQSNRQSGGHQQISSHGQPDRARSAAVFIEGFTIAGTNFPYTINDTLDIQWQPRNDLAIDIGIRRKPRSHGVIPVPFNQPGIASPTNPIHGQEFTYGYQVNGPAGCQHTNSCAPLSLPNGQGPYLATYVRGWKHGFARALHWIFGGIYLLRSGRRLGLQRFANPRGKTHEPHGLRVGFSYTYFAFTR